MLNVNASLDQFEKNVDTLLSEFPLCKSLLNWYLHHDRAKMIFQVLADEKFTQANPNTNAQESFPEQERPSIKDAFYHCYRFALKCDVQAKLNIAPGETRYIEVNMKDFHKIQLKKIDKYFHSGVDAKCGQGDFFL